MLCLCVNVNSYGNKPNGSDFVGFAALSCQTLQSHIGHYSSLLKRGRDGGCFFVKVDCLLQWPSSNLADRWNWVSVTHSSCVVRLHPSSVDDYGSVGRNTTITLFCLFISLFWTQTGWVSVNVFQLNDNSDDLIGSAPWKKKDKWWLSEDWLWTASKYFGVASEIDQGGRVGGCMISMLGKSEERTKW